MMCVAAISIAVVTWALVGYSLAFDGTGKILGGLRLRRCSTTSASSRATGRRSRTSSSSPSRRRSASSRRRSCRARSSSGCASRRSSSSRRCGRCSSTRCSRTGRSAAAGWRRRARSTSRAACPSRWAPGFSALAAALVVGARKDYGRQALLPHNAHVRACSAPACCGSAGSASTAAAGSTTGNNSVLAFTNTLLTPACTLAVWAILDAIRGRQVTAIGAATAIIVGCVVDHARGRVHQPGVGDGARRARRGPELRRPRLADAHAHRRDARRPRGARHRGLHRHHLHRLLRARCSGTASPTACSTATRGSSARSSSRRSRRPCTRSSRRTRSLRVIGAVMPLRGPDDDEAVGMDIIHHGEEAYATGEGALLIGADVHAAGEEGRGRRSRADRQVRAAPAWVGYGALAGQPARRPTRGEPA